MYAQYGALTMRSMGPCTLPNPSHSFHMAETISPAGILIRPGLAGGGGEGRTQLPKIIIMEVPGDYGLPVLGAILDRVDYFAIEGRDEFFRSRMEKYKSTVFRANMPPGPPLFPDPRVIVLLDAKSFPVLFDVAKVDKKNVFTGTYMPSTDFTGGYRVLSYLDPSEENHAKLKTFCFRVLQSNADRWFPRFAEAAAELWRALEAELARAGRADFGDANVQMAFNFLSRSVLDRDPAAPGPASLGTDGPSLIKKWVGLQLAPIASLGILPRALEAIVLEPAHAVPLPFLLVRHDYQRLYEFFSTYGTRALGEAEALGIPRDEACHNLLFILCFNTFGGMMILFPSIVAHLAAAGAGLQADLAAEVRAAVAASGGNLDAAALERMELLRSAVYEVLRIDPPVPFQYGRAKADLIVESHDGGYKVKKGEMLFGYQPFATRDPKVFDDPDDFRPRRFMGEAGHRLLKYLFWSNGPETEDTTVGNKQCAGKNFVVLVARLLVAHLFLRYDFVGAEASSAGSAVVTSLRKPAQSG